MASLFQLRSHLVLLFAVAINTIGWSASAQTIAPSAPGSLDAVAPTQQQTAPSAQAGSQEAEAPATQQQRENLIDLFVKELGELTPGETTDEIEQELRNAVSLFLSGQQVESRALLEKLKSTNPNLPPSDLLLAGICFPANRANQGRLLLEKAAIENPNYPGTYLAFSRIALGQNRYTDARALAEKGGRTYQKGTFTVDERKHFHVHYLRILTAVAIKQNQLGEAKQLATQLRELVPDNPNSLLLNGEVAFLQGEVDKSFEFLEKLHQLDDTTQVPELVITNWFDQQGNLAEVEKWVKTAVNRHPENVAAQTYYALWALKTDNLSVATEAINKADQLKPSRAISVIKSRLFFIQQEYAAAELELEKIFSSSQNDFDVTNLYVLSLIESPSEEKQNKAVQIAEQSLRTVPNNRNAQASLGWTYLRTGKIGKAQQIFARVAAANQTSPETAYFLATLLNDIGEHAQAKNLCESALESKGLFLYRNPATSLLARIQAKLSEETPSTKGNGDLPAPSSPKSPNG